KVVQPSHTQRRGGLPTSPPAAKYTGWCVYNDPLSRAVRTAESATRAEPSGLLIAHQYSSRSGVHVGSESVQSVITPIHGDQCCLAYWKACTMLLAFWSSLTANQA